MSVRIDSLAVTAPWGEQWESARAVLTGERDYQERAPAKFDATWLPATSRRRITPTIRLALAVARAATVDADVDPATLSSVFACSGGDTTTLDKICNALCAEGRPVSPGQFHNSVHNAPAGYWSIATGSREPATSVSAYDGSFAAGLLEAYAMVAVEHRPTLLVAYDEPPPRPLRPFRPIPQAFATAMVMRPETAITAPANGRDNSHIGLSLSADEREDRMPSAALEAVRAHNPAARALPLLLAIARRASARVVLPYLPGAQLVVAHEPC